MSKESDELRLESLNPEVAAKTVADIVKTQGSWGIMSTYEYGQHTVGGVEIIVKDNGFQINALGGHLKSTGMFASVELAIQEKVMPRELGSHRQTGQLVVLVYDIEPDGKTTLARELQKSDNKEMAKSLAEQTGITIQTKKTDDQTSVVAVTIVIPSKHTSGLVEYMVAHPSFGLDIVDAIIPGIDKVAPREKDPTTLRIIQDRRNKFLPILREKSDRTIEIPPAK